MSPTADEPFPDVYTPRGAILCTYASSCDLDVPGSPHMSTLISPRTRPSLPRSLCTPPMIWHSSPFFTSSSSHMLGASDAASFSYTPSVPATAAMRASSATAAALASFACPSPTGAGSRSSDAPPSRPAAPPTFRMWITSTNVLYTDVMLRVRGSGRCASAR